MKTICYCYGYTESDILDDVLKNRGRSTIAEKIVEAKKAGACQCDVKNPTKQ
jgi:hypothetical protein